MCNNGATLTDKSAHKQMIGIVMNRTYDAAGAPTSVGWQTGEMIGCGGNWGDVIRERLSVNAASDDGEGGFENLNWIIHISWLYLRVFY